MDQKTPTGDRKETKTSIDSLLDLLNKYGRRDLTSIAVELGISPAIVESWVKILESGKLVRITYEMGKMYVSPSGKDGTEEEVTVKSEVTKSAIENEVELDKLILDKFSEKVQRLSSITNNMPTIRPMSALSITAAVAVGSMRRKSISDAAPVTAPNAIAAMSMFLTKSYMLIFICCSFIAASRPFRFLPMFSSLFLNALGSLTA